MSTTPFASPERTCAASRAKINALTPSRKSAISALLALTRPDGDSPPVVLGGGSQSQTASPLNAPTVSPGASAARRPWTLGALRTEVGPTMAGLEAGSTMRGRKVFGAAGGGLAVPQPVLSLASFDHSAAKTPTLTAATPPPARLLSIEGVGVGADTVVMGAGAGAAGAGAAGLGAACLAQTPSVAWPLGSSPASVVPAFQTPSPTPLADFGAPLRPHAPIGPGMGTPSTSALFPNTGPPPTAPVSSKRYAADSGAHSEAPTPRQNAKKRRSTDPARRAELAGATAPRTDRPAAPAKRKGCEKAGATGKAKSKAKAKPRKTKTKPPKSTRAKIGRKTDFVARKLPNERNKRGVTMARRLVNEVAGIPVSKRWRHGVGSQDTAINGRDAEQIISVFRQFFPSYMTDDQLHSTPIPESVAIEVLGPLATGEDSEPSEDALTPTPSLP